MEDVFQGESRENRVLEADTGGGEAAKAEFLPHETRQAGPRAPAVRGDGSKRGAGPHQGFGRGARSEGPRPVSELGDVRHREKKGFESEK